MDVALEHVLQRRSRGLDTKFQLLQHKLGPAFDRGIDDLAGVGSYSIIVAGCFDRHRRLATPAAEIMRG
jgi:hypothetical protein